jgi:hypothetical protein
MKRYRINKKRFGLVVLLFVAVIFITGFAVDVVRFPECYFSTWRYQLQCDLTEGDKDAVAYYETTYIANGKELFKCN